MEQHSRRLAPSRVPTPLSAVTALLKRRRSESPQLPSGEEQNRESNLRAVRDIVKSVALQGGGTQGSSAGQIEGQSQEHPEHNSAANISDTNGPGASSTGPSNTESDAQYRLNAAQWQEQSQMTLEHARARAAQMQRPPSYQEHRPQQYLPPAHHSNQLQQHLPPTPQYVHPQRPLPAGQVPNHPQSRDDIPHGYRRMIPGLPGRPAHPQLIRNQNPQQVFPHIRRYDMPPPPPPPPRPSFPQTQHNPVQAGVVFNGQQPVRHAAQALPEPPFAGTHVQRVLPTDQDEAKPNAPTGESRPPKRMRLNREPSENRKAASKRLAVVKIIRASAELLESLSPDSDEDEEK